MGKMLYIEACCSCRYFEYDEPLKNKVYCTFYNRRRIPDAKIDVSAETPDFCPLPDWDGVTAKKGRV